MYIDVVIRWYSEFISGYFYALLTERMRHAKHLGMSSRK